MHLGNVVINTSNGYPVLIDHGRSIALNGDKKQLVEKAEAAKNFVIQSQVLTRKREKTGSISKETGSELQDEVFIAKDFVGLAGCIFEINSKNVGFAAFFTMFITKVEANL